MRFRFLCKAHVEELENNRDRAINCWQNGFDAGQSLYAQKMWQQALPHSGCAFEASEILIKTEAIERDAAYELFVSSAMLLMSVFGKLSYAQQCQEIYAKAVYRLTNELSCNNQKDVCITQYLNDLHHCIQQLNAST